MEKETIIISAYNNKGGVAKTTYNCMLALSLAREGKKVLVIDGDPQSNTTSKLYAYKHNDLTLGDLILNKDKVSIEDGIIKGFLEDYPSLDIIPANRDMKFLEEVLLGMDKTRERDFVIAGWMAENYNTISQYDYVIWDISPSTSILGRNIINTCNRLLFVSEYNNIDSLEAIPHFINDYKKDNNEYGIDIPKFAILINKYKNTNEANNMYEQIEECIEIVQENLLKTKMIESSVVRKCSLFRQDIIAYTESNRLNNKAMNLFMDIMKELREKEII